MVNESLQASATKAIAVNTGAVISMATSSGVWGTVAGILAATYSVIQIIKSLPWITDYVVAVRSGIHGDWSHWRSIARREEKANDNAKS